MTGLPTRISHGRPGKAAKEEISRGWGVFCFLLLALAAALIIYGCSSAPGQLELMDYVPGIEPTPTNTLAPISTGTSTVTPTNTQTPKPSHEWTICTGIERGYLNVRACAGTMCPAVAVLREGRAVTGPGLTQTLPSGSWVMITDPTDGWINAKYICKDKE